MSSIIDSSTYQQLSDNQRLLFDESLLSLFEENPNRADTFSLEHKHLFLDYSKNYLTEDTLELLIQFAKERKLPQEIEKLLSGYAVNNTEQRPALHSALRFQGKPNTPEQHLVAEAQALMEEHVESLHSGQWTGFSGKSISTVINIGIGGSDLGPRLVKQALTEYSLGIDVKFVANIDGADLHDTLKGADPETTLFIVSSKSFSTQETLENACSARQWLTEGECPQAKLENHFIAITSNISAAAKLGVNPNNILPMWDWVGGRYSLWSAIGLPIAIAIGMENFHALLRGANQIDQHFQNSPLEENLPVIAALLTFWYTHFWGCSSHAILPYAQRLNRLPAYLQQLDMESLGKSVTRDGNKVDYNTGSIIWGTEGSNGQHSFHQLLHQGTQLTPADFILCATPMSSLKKQHNYLQAAGISQTQALLQGKTHSQAEEELRLTGLSEDEVQNLAPHKVIKGNKPSNTIIIDKLCPEALGSLIAFYEHKVYALSVLMDINPFDQWGVELGKQLGQPIYEALNKNEKQTQWDSSTCNLIERLRANRS